MKGNNMGFKTYASFNYATHLPCLMKAVEKTTGDILELGVGLFSTPYLHYVAMLQNRKLVSYENVPEWAQYFIDYGYQNENHEIYIIDSYAWIEYSLGSEKGLILKGLFGTNSQFYTLDCCLAEIKGWCLRNNKPFDEFYSLIQINSDVISIANDEWIKVGECKYLEHQYQRNFGLIDAALLILQLKLGAKIITGDSHFKDKKNIVFMN